MNALPFQTQIQQKLEPPGTVRNIAHALQLAPYIKEE